LAHKGAESAEKNHKEGIDSDLSDFVFRALGPDRDCVVLDQWQQLENSSR